MQADSASLFGFRKQALWKDKRQTHGMDFRLVRSVTAISIQFLTVPQPAGRHYLLLRLDPGRNVWGKARGNVRVTWEVLRARIELAGLQTCVRLQVRFSGWRQQSQDLHCNHASGRFHLLKTSEQV